MKALMRWICAASLLTLAFAQDNPTPAKFEAADHIEPKPVEK